MPEKPRDYEKEWASFIDGLVDSELELSDQQILESVQAEGEDPNAIANNIRQLFKTTDKNFRQERLRKAKKEHEEQVSKIRSQKYILPKKENERRELFFDILKNLPSMFPEFTFQNRNFKDLTDKDIESSLKQLVDLGLISLDSSEDQN